MTVTIRRATPADAAGFARVMSDPAVYPGLMQLPFNNEHQWRERLTESTGAGKIDLVLVAERDGTIVGNSGLHLNATPHYVRRRHAAAIGIAVAPEAQGQGVGTALMQAMCDYADRWIGLLRLELTVYVDNARGDRPLHEVRLRDRGALSRLCDARRRAGRCLHDGPHPSRAADDRSARPGRSAASVRVALVLLALSGALGTGRRRRRGAGVVSEPRRRRRAGRPHRSLVPGRECQPDRSGAERGPVPRLRRRLRPARPAVAADAGLRGALQPGRLLGPGGRFARRRATRSSSAPSVPARGGSRSRTAASTRSAPSPTSPSAPTSIRAGSAWSAGRTAAAPCSRRPTCAIATSPRRWCSRPSRSPSIPAARPS